MSRDVVMWLLLLLLLLSASVPVSTPRRRRAVKLEFNGSSFLV